MNREQIMLNALQQIADQRTKDHAIIIAKHALRDIEQIKTIVVNINETCEYDIFIGRPSKWGNHIRLADYNHDRALVIRMFRQWLMRKAQQKFRQEVCEMLAGKRLGCYCTSEYCHGNVYVELIEGKLGEM